MIPHMSQNRVKVGAIVLIKGYFNDRRPTQRILPNDHKILENPWRRFAAIGRPGLFGNWSYLHGKDTQIISRFPADDNHGTWWWLGRWGDFWAGGFWGRGAAVAGQQLL